MDGDASLSSAIRGVARSSRGTCYTHGASLVTAGPAGAARRRRVDVARAAAQFGSVTTALVGIGAWRPRGSALYGALDAAEARTLGCAGACVEIAGVILTADGTPLGGVAPRTVGATVDQLRAIPRVVGVAEDDPTDVPAVAAALRSGVVNGLVTRRSVAVALGRS